MALSRSDCTFLAVPSSPDGLTAISFATTSVPATERAIASARVLSSSVGTFPVKVTTFLSRSWLTLMSLSPA